MMADKFDTEVLIVGGGPVGLATALDLAWRGNSSMLVEREAATGGVLLAKANGLHERTMETCRRWGLIDRVVARGFPPDPRRPSSFKARSRISRAALLVKVTARIRLGVVPFWISRAMR